MFSYFKAETLFLNIWHEKAPKSHLILKLQSNFNRDKWAQILQQFYNKMSSICHRSGHISYFYYISTCWYVRIVFRYILYYSASIILFIPLLLLLYFFKFLVVLILLFYLCFCYIDVSFLKHEWIFTKQRLHFSSSKYGRRGCC